ncbi:MAG: toxin-antitoxin system HicB family antitoxin [Candidatus Dormibacteria bacterium]
MSRLEEYLDLPYEVVLVRDQDDQGSVGWVAEVEELPGCLSQGATPEDAVSHLRDAMVGWLSIALEDGREIPLPRAQAPHSGRFLVRLPQSLHADLTRTAEREGVSLNQLVTNLLASAVGWRGGKGKVA